MPEPYESMENLTDFPSMITFVNDATGQIFSHFFILALFVIVFLAVGSRDTITGLATAGFISFIASVLMWGMGAVSGVAVIITLVITILTVFALYVRK